MALTFDTLAFTKTLEAGGVARDIAETHATAVRDHVMRDIATREEIRAMFRESELRMTVRLGSMLLALAALLISATAFFAGT